MNDKAKRLLNSGTENVSQSFYDEFVQTNAEQRASAGLKTTITREQLGTCCSWCAEIEGTYDIDKAPEDIYKRHRFCKCMVTVHTEKGYTDAWSKKTYGTQRAARIARENEILQEKSANNIKNPLETEKKVLDEIKKENDKIFTTPDKETIIIKQKQFGKKIGKHAEDYGLDPTNPEARLKLELHIKDIIGDYDEYRIGKWRGGKDEYKFFLKGDDVIIVSDKNEFVTILKGGKNNGFFNSARIKNRRR